MPLFPQAPSHNVPPGLSSCLFMEDLLSLAMPICVELWEECVRLTEARSIPMAYDTAHSASELGIVLLHRGFISQN